MDNLWSITLKNAVMIASIKSIITSAIQGELKAIAAHIQRLPSHHLYFRVCATKAEKTPSDKIRCRTLFAQRVLSAVHRSSRLTSTVRLTV